MPVVLCLLFTNGGGLGGFGIRAHMRHVRCGVVIAVTSLRSRDRATSPSCEMDCGTSHAAVAARSESNSKSRCCGCAHAEVRIAEVLSAQRPKRDGLVRFGNREGLRHVRCRVVIAVTSLRSHDSATSPSRDVNCGTGHAAVAARSKAYRQVGRCAGAHTEVRIAKRPSPQLAKCNRLAGFGD